jgi:general secretion pathway protein A
MYLSFYNLKKQPFHITPDPEFLYLSPSHKEAMAGIIYGIEERKGFVAITGAVGVGKTTILRSYLERADRSHLKIIYIFNARLTFEGLVRTIYQELGLRIESDDVLEMVNRLYEVLIEEYKQGNTVVMVIDEAQNMPVDTLEDLRMLSNLETSKDKLIQIVLVGQPEFEDELSLNRLRQLKQRLAVRSRILPLTKEESLEYIKFRLQRAGSNGDQVFTTSALKTIIKSASGIPRVINILCDNALITGFGYQRKPVSVKIAKEILNDLSDSKSKSFTRWWPLGVLAMALLLVAIIWFWPHVEPAVGKIGGVGPSRHERKEADTSVREAIPVVKPAAETEDVQPIPAKEDTVSPVLKGDPPAIKKAVVQGDTLTKLSLEVYGYVDSDLVKWVHKNNPHISDPNIIPVGITVIFPKEPLPKKARVRQGADG